jgi:hypothetical protein
VKKRAVKRKRFGEETGEGAAGEGAAGRRAAAARRATTEASDA